MSEVTHAHADAVLDRLAHAFVNPLRAPILHTPAEENLEFEEVS